MVRPGRHSVTVLNPEQADESNECRNADGKDRRIDEDRTQEAAKMGQLEGRLVVGPQARDHVRGAAQALLPQDLALGQRAR